MSVEMRDVPSVAVIDVDRPRHLVALSNHLVAFSRLAALSTSFIGAFVLFGYVIRWRFAVQLHSSLPPMYPSTALGFVAGGVGCLLAGRSSPRPRLSTVLFALVATFGAVTLILHTRSAAKTWLEGLWPDRPFIAATTQVAGRPAVETCVAFVCIGVAGVLLSIRRAARLTQGLALGTMSVGAAAIVGYVIGVNRTTLATSFVVVGMALHTAIALTFLGASVLLAQPTVGLFSRLTTSGPSAELGRRLVLVVVAAPIGLTAVFASLIRWSPDARLAQSVAAVLQVVALGLLVMVPISAAERVEFAAATALHETRRLAEELGERDRVMATIGRELSSPPRDFDGWTVGFRQSVAIAELPGDSCQLLGQSDDRMLLAVVDVAGHGTEAALQALRLRNEIAALWLNGHSIGPIATHLDGVVREMATIATGVLIAIDPRSGHCEYLNAGHLAPLLLNNGQLDAWNPTQMLFGVAHTDPVVATRYIERHAMLVVYTDGVPEARSKEGIELGSDTVQRIVRQFANGGPQAVADACVDAALELTGARLRDDALTVVLSRG